MLSRLRKPKKKFSVSSVRERKKQGGLMPGESLSFWLIRTGWRDPRTKAVDAASRDKKPFRRRSSCGGKNVSRCEVRAPGIQRALEAKGENLAGRGVLGT